MRGLVSLLLLAVAGCASVAVPPRQTTTPTSARTEAAKADFLVIRKQARTLEAWSGERLLLTIGGIQLGPAPVGPKRFEGDGKTPEGRYRIDWRNPRSAYHLSLHVSYPDAAATAYARAQGRSAGGLIMIHGQPNGTPARIAGDWTDGCIAVSDREIEVLWNLVADGAQVLILA